MPKITASDVKVPADVPSVSAETYIENYLKATANSGHLMLYACDQKVEHLNKDFYDGGNKIDLSDAQPEHLFKIAEAGRWSKGFNFTIC
ncbi:MAG: hypothetical protein MJ189_01530 [Coriobacteriales bacterium]|nr:hypothetical protein [Coriobacteriales bacterium]